MSNALHGVTLSAGSFLKWCRRVIVHRLVINFVEIYAFKDGIKGQQKADETGGNASAGFQSKRQHKVIGVVLWQCVHRICHPHM